MGKTSLVAMIERGEFLKSYAMTNVPEPHIIPVPVEGNPDMRVELNVIDVCGKTVFYPFDTGESWVRIISSSTCQTADDAGLNVTPWGLDDGRLGSGHRPMQSSSCMMSATATASRPWPSGCEDSSSSAALDLCWVRHSLPLPTDHRVTDDTPPPPTPSRGQDSWWPTRQTSPPTAWPWPPKTQQRLPSPSVWAWLASRSRMVWEWTCPSRVLLSRSTVPTKSGWRRLLRPYPAPDHEDSSATPFLRSSLTLISDYNNCDEDDNDEPSSPSQ